MEIMTHSTEIQKDGNISHKAVPLLEATLTGN